MSLVVDPKMSVKDFKILVQTQATPSLERRGPLRPLTKGVTREFSRLFLDGTELVDDDSILETCGLKTTSLASFGVGKALGNKLRTAMRTVGEDFDDVDDANIMAQVLSNVRGRVLDPDGKATKLICLLYKVFNVNFKSMEGVHEGYLSVYNQERVHGEYIQWKVEELVPGSFPFETLFGIPVYTLLYGRTKQRIAGHPHPTSLVTGTNDPTVYNEASAGFFSGPRGQQMACTAHFAGSPGTAVLLTQQGEQVGRTAVSNASDDFAVVDMGVDCVPGQVSTTEPEIDLLLHHPATYQTAQINNAYITEVSEKKLVVQEPLGPGAAASPQAGDSNCPWNTPTGRTIGIHRTGGPAGDMSVVRLDIPEFAGVMAGTVRRSRRRRLPHNAGEEPENKRRRTDATA